jgi:type IV pilus assembly protein PilF
MKRQLLGLTLVALLLSAGCVSTTTDSKANPGDREEKPVDAAAYNTQLAIAYLKQNNLAAAREKIDRALSQDGQNAKARTTAGLIYDRLGEDKKAEGFLSSAVRIAPDDPEVLNNYGVYLCRKGHDRAKEGAKLFQKAASNPLYRTPEIAYNNAGLCMKNAGMLPEAQQNFERALAIKPRFADALLQLADVNFAQGKMSEAQALVQRYLGGLPANAQILWLGVRVERALGNSAAADAYAKRLKTEYPKTEQTKALLESERQSG